MLNAKLTTIAGVVAASLTLGGCANTPLAGGSVSSGSPNATAVSGAAGGGTSAGANVSLERCPAPLGTLAVDDGRGKEWYASFGAATRVTTIEPLIRLAVQQSNCFVITSVGNARTESKLSAITRQAAQFGRVPRRAPSSRRVSASRQTTTWSRRSSSTTHPPAGWPVPWAPAGSGRRVGRCWYGEQGLRRDHDPV
jgi:hypothetical protein